MSKNFEELNGATNFPNTVTVYDVAEILGISPKEVREQCKNGTLIATETLPDSGRWRIQTEQLKDKGKWTEFLEKRGRIKEQSLRVAEFMVNEIKSINEN